MSRQPGYRASRCRAWTTTRRPQGGGCTLRYVTCSQYNRIKTAYQLHLKLLPQEDARAKTGPEVSTPFHRVPSSSTRGDVAHTSCAIDMSHVPTSLHSQALNPLNALSRALAWPCSTCAPTRLTLSLATTVSPTSERRSRCLRAPTLDPDTPSRCGKPTATLLCHQSGWRPAASHAAATLRVASEHDACAREQLRRGGGSGRKGGGGAMPPTCAVTRPVARAQAHEKEQPVLVEDTLVDGVGDGRWRILNELSDE